MFSHWFTSSVWLLCIFPVLLDLDPHPGTCQSGTISVSTKCSQTILFPENFNKLSQILKNYDANDAHKKEKGVGYGSGSGFGSASKWKVDPGSGSASKWCGSTTLYFPMFSGQKVAEVQDQILHSHSSQPLGTVYNVCISSKAYIHMESLPPITNSTEEFISHGESIPWGP